MGTGTGRREAAGVKRVMPPNRAPGSIVRRHCATGIPVTRRRTDVPGSGTLGAMARDPPAGTAQIMDRRALRAARIPIRPRAVAATDNAVAGSGLREARYAKPTPASAPDCECYGKM